MESFLKTLFIDPATGFYRINRYTIGEFFGPVDLGLHLSGKHKSLNIGTGLLAGSIFPGSNRLIFTGFSPAWCGFYISSMGGAGLVFDNLGINMVSLIGKARTPSILCLNRTHGEEIEVQVAPVDLTAVWKSGRGGIYSLMDHAYGLFGEGYVNDPRILAVGPAAMATDFGAIASAPIVKKSITAVDTWAGRGGFGSKMLQDHGIAAIIYGGTFIDEDFRDRTVADKWFQNRYSKKLAAKDLESTVKYRYDPTFNTGGTFGVNFATLKGRIMAFNYNTIFMGEEDRISIHNNFIVNHYLKQFNEETIEPKQQKHCGEPCSALCKKMMGQYKKDYEPYQTLGPLCGIFDQRAAEKINHHADTCGFDAISAGGVLSWLMESLSQGLISPEELGISGIPVFSPDNFRVVEDSMLNADIGIQILDAIIEKRGVLNLAEGARKLAHSMASKGDKKIIDSLVFCANGPTGWMVPNQYWTAGVLSPMPIMGKYYMHYGSDFLPPRELGRKNAERFRQELILDNMGMCRFHRQWAEEMVPDIIGSLFGLKDEFLKKISDTCRRINSRNSSVYWESRKNVDYIYTFLKRHQNVEKNNDPELAHWIEYFERDKEGAALDFWYEVHKGINITLNE